MRTIGLHRPAWSTIREARSPKSGLVSRTVIEAVAVRGPVCGKQPTWRLASGADQRHHGGMPALTRRRDPDAREEAWLIYYGDVHVGSIGIRSDNPTGGDQWSWHCGFYPGSNPGDAANGTATNFDAARAAFESAWSVLLSKRTDAEPAKKKAAGRSAGFAQKKPALRSKPYVSIASKRTASPMQQKKRTRISNSPSTSAPVRRERASAMPGI
jgi:hypothetical protein